MRRRSQPLTVVDPDAALARLLTVLAKNVRERRRAAGVSQERLAEIARVSTIYLGQLERGTASNPSLAVVAALAEALECSVIALLDDLSAGEARVTRRASGLTVTARASTTARPRPPGSGTRPRKKAT